MQIKEMIKNLTVQMGVSGYEEDFSKKVKDLLQNYCQETFLKTNGNVVGFFKKIDPQKKTILLEAHLDRIGLIVSEICDDGFLKFCALGGVDERILPASEVYILGSETLFGVIGAVPPHLNGMSDGDGKNPKISDMLIDTGLTKEEATRKISVGSPILMKSEFLELKDERLSAAALDNRCGMAAIFNCLECLKDKELPVNLVVAFTVGEELGLQGAWTLDTGLEIDLAVVVDVTHGRTLDSEKIDTFELGSGAVICRGPNFDRKTTDKIIELAKAKNIPYDIEVAPGNSGTNAWALQVSGGGTICALVSVPLRYMHTTVETVALRDVEATSNLLFEIVLGGEEIA